ncbi:hypothetical protein JCM3770_000512 [Rhodotorula araucariae]
MASLFFQTASAPQSAAGQGGKDSPASRYDTASLPWAASPAARARFPASALSSTSATPAHPRSQHCASPSTQMSASAHTSPATSFESGGDSEDEPHLLTPEDRIHVFDSQIATPAPVHPLTGGFDFYAYRDEARASVARLGSPEQALSASAKAFFPSFGDLLTAPAARGLDTGFGLGIWVGDEQGRVDDLAHKTAELDLRKTTSSVQPRRDSFTFFPSPTLHIESSSQNDTHRFASSAALRSPQPSPAPLQRSPVAFFRQAFDPAATAPPVWNDAGYFPVGEVRAATAPTTTFAPAHAPSAPPLVPVPSLLPAPPLWPYITLSGPSGTPPGAASLPGPRVLSAGRLLAVAPRLAVSTRSSPGPASPSAAPYEDYPLSPADTDRIAQVHNGRIPSLQQLAPPPQNSAAHAAPVINTGNQGPMVLQAGDWRCGVICVKCFPYAHDIGNILTIRSQGVAYLAHPASHSSSLTSPASSTPPLRHRALAVPPGVDNAYFGPNVLFPARVPPQVHRRSSNSVPSASVAALARVRTTDGSHAHAPAQAPFDAEHLTPVHASRATSYVMSQEQVHRQPATPALALAAAAAPRLSCVGAAPSTPEPRVQLAPVIWTSGASPSSAASGGSSSAGSAGEFAARRAAAAPGQLRGVVRGQRAGASAAKQW